MAQPPSPDLHDELAGMTALVTGSSRGIGRAIALELASGGANVAVHSRTSRPAAEAVVRQIRDMGQASEVFAGDFGDQRVIPELVDRVWSWQEGLHILVNNAGADVLTGAAAEWSFEEKLARLWQVDVRGTIVLSRMLGQRMRTEMSADSTCSILNIGWDQAETGMEGDSGEMFAATKGAIMAFTRSAAQSLAPQVRVNCLAPGWIRTTWGEMADEYWQQRACRESLLGRWGPPNDVAQYARFLVSPAAGFVTGQVIHVNGGQRRGTDPNNHHADGERKICK